MCKRLVEFVGGLSFACGDGVHVGVYGNQLVVVLNGHHQFADAGQLEGNGRRSGLSVRPVARVLCVALRQGCAAARGGFRCAVCVAAGWRRAGQGGGVLLVSELEALEVVGLLGYFPLDAAVPVVLDGIIRPTTKTPVTQAPGPYLPGRNRAISAHLFPILWCRR